MHTRVFPHTMHMYIKLNIFELADCGRTILMRCFELQYICTYRIELKSRIVGIYMNERQNDNKNINKKKNNNKNVPIAICTYT